jgi:hypothetical protein
MFEQLIAEAGSYQGDCPQTIEEILAECGVRARRPTVVPYVWVPRHLSDDAGWDKFWSDGNLQSAFLEVQEEDKDDVDDLEESDNLEHRTPMSIVEDDRIPNIDCLETEFKIEMVTNRLDALSEGLIEVDRSEEIRFETVSTPFLKPESVIDFVVD